MRKKQAIAVPVAALVLGGAGWVTYSAAAGPDSSFRTATAVLGDVDRTIDVNGTVSPTGRADLAFGTDGEVAEVRVAEGDSVAAGDVIAVLDRRELRAVLKTARADLAEAKAQLESHKAAQADTVSEAAADPDTPTTGDQAAPPVQEPAPDNGGDDSGNKPAGGAPSTNAPTDESSGGKDPGGDAGSAELEAALAELATQQEAVTSAQSAASDAIATADEALATQQKVCSAADSPEEEEDDGGGSSGGGAEETPSEASTGSTDAGVSEECEQALTAVQSAQALVSDAQATLQTSLGILGGTLQAAAKALAEADQQPQAEPTQPKQPEQEQPEQPEQERPEQQQPERQEPSSGTDPNGPGTQDGMTTTVTAATLAQDQAAIDQAEAALLSAEEARAGAVVRAPAAGKVVSLAVEEGDDVTAGAAAAVVVGKGLTAIDVEVSASQAGQLEVGQESSVTPAGSEEALTGTVTRIQHTPVEDESADADSGPRAASTETTYPVTITLEATDLALASGMPADVEVTVAQVTDTLTVPTSAVANGSVTVLDNGAASRVPVTTGIMGDTRTEIVDGLEDGAEVVLADLEAELPTGESDTGRPAGFGGGGRGGRGGGVPPGFGG